MAENYNTNDHINRGHTQSDKPRRVVRLPRGTETPGENEESEEGSE